MIDIDQSLAGVQGEMVVLIEAPLDELFELLEGGVGVLDDFGGHQADLILAGTSP
jgi:hypothetical protein